MMKIKLVLLIVFITFCSGNQCSEDSFMIYTHNGNQCRKCSEIFENCYSCDESYSCKTCKEGYIMFEDKDDPYFNKCVDSKELTEYVNCNDGYFKDNVTCIPCHESCKTCNGKYRTNCLSCENGFDLINGYCVKQRKEIVNCTDYDFDGK